MNIGGWMLFGNQGRENHRLDVSKRLFCNGIFTPINWITGKGGQLQAAYPFYHKSWTWKLPSILARKFHVGDTPMDSTLNHDFFRRNGDQGTVASSDFLGEKTQNGMCVSENGGTPKSSNLIGLSIINSILGYPYFWKHPLGKA